MADLGRVFDFRTLSATPAELPVAAPLTLPQQEPQFMPLLPPVLPQQATQLASQYPSEPAAPSEPQSPQLFVVPDEPVVKPKPKRKSMWSDDNPRPHRKSNAQYQQEYRDRKRQKHPELMVAFDTWKAAEAERNRIVSEWDVYLVYLKGEYEKLRAIANL